MSQETKADRHHRDVLRAVSSLDSKLNEILALARATRQEEAEIVAIGQDIIDDIAAESTTIDSIKALLDAFVANGNITQAQADAIKAAFAANDAKLSALEAALQPAPPPPPPTP